MALILEIGEGSSDADSFVSLAEVRAFADSRGVTLTEVDSSLEVTVRDVHDYILNREELLQGERTKQDQSLPFPRTGLWLFGKQFSSTAIPSCLKTALCQLVLEALEQPLLPSTDGRLVIEETVGPLSTKYSEQQVSPVLPRVEAHLKQLYRHGGGCVVVRV